MSSIFTSIVVPNTWWSIVVYMYGSLKYGTQNGEFGGFKIRCATRGEAKTHSELSDKADIQSPHNMNVTREQMPMFIQFVNIN